MIKTLITILSLGLAVTLVTITSDSVFQYTDAQPNQNFIAILSPNEVVPTVNSQATGIVKFTVVGDTIKYTINASNIQGATVSHIHMGTKGKNGMDLATLFDNNIPKDKVAENGVLTKESGLFEELTDMTTPMLDGELYVDIHTTQNPNGEIRGQIIPN